MVASLSSSSTKELQRCRAPHSAVRSSKTPPHSVKYSFWSILVFVRVSARHSLIFVWRAPIIPPLRWCVPVPVHGVKVLITSLSSKAYHVSNDKYSIATVNHGVGATVKIWTSVRPSHEHERGQVSDGTGERLSNVEWPVSCAVGFLPCGGVLLLLLPCWLCCLPPCRV